MSDEKTIPPIIQKADNAAKSIWAWSQVHTVAATGIGSFVAGFIVGKLF